MLPIYCKCIPSRLTVRAQEYHRQTLLMLLLKELRVTACAEHGSKDRQTACACVHACITGARPLSCSRLQRGRYTTAVSPNYIYTSYVIVYICYSIYTSILQPVPYNLNIDTRIHIFLYSYIFIHAYFCTLYHT